MSLYICKSLQRNLIFLYVINNIPIEFPVEFQDLRFKLRYSNLHSNFFSVFFQKFPLIFQRKKIQRILILPISSYSKYDPLKKRGKVLAYSSLLLLRYVRWKFFFEFNSDFYDD